MRHTIIYIYIYIYTWAGFGPSACAGRWEGEARKHLRRRHKQVVMWRTRRLWREWKVQRKEGTSEVCRCTHLRALRHEHGGGGGLVCTEPCRGQG